MNLFLAGQGQAAKRLATLFVGVACLVGWTCTAFAEQSTGPSASGRTAPAVADSAFPYVNSAGLRLRDFPSVSDGAVVATLDEGVALEIDAVTEWKDEIGGARYPWYRVTVRDGSGRTGWVYGEYVSFRPGYPVDFWNVQVASRQEMNRPLLVLQIFRDLLGTETGYVSTTWLEGLPLANETEAYQGKPTGYSLRTYPTSFGRLLVRYNKEDRQQLVLEISVDSHVRGTLLAVGDPVSKVQRLLGSNYFENRSKITYRASPDVESYALSFQVENGIVTMIHAGALIE